MERETIGSIFFSQTIALAVLVAPLIVGAAQGPKPEQPGRRPIRRTRRPGCSRVGKASVCRCRCWPSGDRPTLKSKARQIWPRSFVPMAMQAEVKEFKAGTPSSRGSASAVSGDLRHVREKELCEKSRCRPGKKITG